MSDTLAPVAPVTQAPAREPFTVEEANALPDLPDYQAMPPEKREEAVNQALSDVYSQVRQEQDFDAETDAAFTKLATRLHATTEPSWTSTANDIAKGTGEAALGMVKGAAGVVAGAFTSPIDTAKLVTKGAAYNVMDWGRLGADQIKRVPGSKPYKLFTGLDEFKADIDSGKFSVRDPDKAVSSLLERATKLKDYQDGATSLDDPEIVEMISDYMHTRSPKIWREIVNKTATSPGQRSMQKFQEDIVTEGKDVPFAQDVVGLADPAMALLPGAGKVADIVGKPIITRVASETGKKATKGAIMAGELGATGALMAERMAPTGATTGEMGIEALKMILIGGAMHGAPRAYKAIQKRVSSEPPPVMRGSEQAPVDSPTVEGSSPSAGRSLADELFSNKPIEVTQTESGLTDPVTVEGDATTGLQRSTEPAKGLDTNFPLKGRTGGYLNADIINHGVTLIKRGITDFAKWSRAMLAKFGQAIKSSLQAIWNQVIPTEVRNAGPNARGSGLGAAGVDAKTEAWRKTATPDEIQYGVHNKAVNERRAGDGLPPVVKSGPVSTEQMLAEGKAIMDANPGVAPQLVDKILSGNYNANYKDLSVLIHEMRRVSGVIRDARESLKHAPDETSREVTEMTIDGMTEYRDQLDSAVDATGNQGALLQVFRKVHLQEDYSPRWMAERMAKAKGSPLNEKEMAEVEKLHEEISALKDRQSKLNEELESERLKKVTAGIAADVPASDLPTLKKKLTAPRKEKTAEGEVDVTDLEAIARAAIQRGVTEVNALVTEIANVVNAAAKVNPDISPITENGVRQALTNYGEVKYPSQEATDKRLRQAKQEMLIIQKLEEVKKGIMYAKTGMQRDKLTVVARELQKELNDIVREKGLERVTEDQGASARDRIITRLKNSIEELNRIISGRAKMRGKKPGPAYDPAMEALLKERNELAAYLDDLNGKRNKTPEEYNAALVNVAQRMERYYRDRARRQQWTPEEKAKHPVSKLAKDAQEKAKQAREDFELARNAADPNWNAEKELARTKNRMMKRIAELSKILRERTMPTSGSRTPRPLDAEGRALKMEMDSLTRAVSEWNKTTGAGEMRRVAGAEKALERSIAELERRIKEQDTSVRTGRLPAESPRLKALRQQRDFLSEIYDAIKEAKRPTIDPVAQRLALAKKAIAKSIGELERRIRDKDYSKKTKREAQIDDELLDLQIKKSELQRKFEEDRFKYEIENETKPQRAYRYLSEVMNFIRAYWTSGEMSAIGRQGLYLLFNYPILGMKAISRSFDSFKSNERMLRREAIMARNPNFYLAKKSGLAITDPNSFNKKKVEEEFMSRLAMKAPVMAHFARAYASFLNELRFMSFDAEVTKHRAKNNGEITPEAAKDIAEHINRLSGRSSLGTLENAGPALNTFLFAAKFLASRMELATGKGFLWHGNVTDLLHGKMSLRLGGSNKTSAMIGMSYAKSIAGLGVIYALRSILGNKEEREKTELDPRSTAWMKGVEGDIRTDNMAGVAQVVVFGTQMLLEERLTNKGVQSLTDKKFGKRDLGDTLSSFARSKINPWVGKFWDWKTGEFYDGSEFSWKKVAKDSMIPMTWNDIKGVWESDQVSDFTKGRLSTEAFFGVGVKRYEPR